MVLSDPPEDNFKDVLEKNFSKHWVKKTFAGIP
jgi:hypothetical protein